MSRLDDIRERLYKRKPEPEDLQRGSGTPPSASDERLSRTWSNLPSDRVTIMGRPPLAPNTRTMFRTVVGITVGAVVLLGAFIAYLVFFASPSVTFELLAADQVSAGEATAFTFRIVNKSSATLKEGDATITFPEGTLTPQGGDISAGPVRVRIDIPDILPGGELQRDIQMRLVGTRDEVKTISGIYVYRPENIQSKLTREANLAVTITRVPLVITVDVPGRVSSGQDVTLAVGVDSELSSSIPGLTLGIDYPSGFRVASSDPAPSSDNANLWPLADLKPGTSQKITIRGTVSGDPEEAKSFHLRLGRYNPDTRQWYLFTESTVGPTIASPFLLVRTTLNGGRDGTLQAATQVSGNITFKNNLPQKIDNVTVTMSFPEAFVELATVQAANGFYDVTNHALTWNPASEPRLKELDPGTEGTLPFSFTIKGALPIQSFKDKNFTFPVTTSIDSSSPPPEYRGVSLVYQDRIQFKFSSGVSLAARASYRDSPVPNTGPLPPKVRETTSYTIFLQLSSGANDVADIDVKAVLPGGVAWQGVVANDRGTVSFNPASQQIDWRVVSLPAATGILRSPSTAILQVSLTPADNQVNSSPLLLKDISVGGRDVFTGDSISGTVPNLTTEIRSDSQTTSSDWQVVP